MKIIKYRISPLVKAVFQQYDVLAIYVFGSHAKGTTHFLSDLDIGVIFKDFPKQKRNTEEIYTEILAALKKEFKGKNIDLVFLQEAPISLQFDALVNGQCIFTVDQTKLSIIKEEVMNKHYDFRPVSKMFYDTLIKSV